MRGTDEFDQASAKRMTFARKNCAQHAGVLVLITALGYSTNVASQGSATQAKAEQEVRIQVCVPSKRIYFNDLELDQLENHPNFTRYSKQQLELAPKTIRRVAPIDDPRVMNDPRAVKSYGINFAEALNRAGGFSMSSGFMPVEDSTISGQPVYEKGYGFPAKNYIAIRVALLNADVQSGTTSPTFWFKLPSTISADKFSDWLPPVSTESEPSSSQFWYGLSNGKDLPIQAIPANAPKIRVSLRKSRQPHTDPATDFLPALTTARLKLRTATSGSQFVYEFVAKTNEVIPDC
ncbi:hypothetical protein SAMN05216350_101311 [Polaromonas sp. YR568]|uniref:hypothetical protein n=1 Tax=Polaromonas sp. YR568 TaxID=1855301 RepID=UPI0008EA854D|nr:hypothetical protein [Polaromonas sp. YR568]SFU32221.1 hypothetical protein SAMN05216350_101311 [Polaromonas sp. YR568]